VSLTTVTAATLPGGRRCVRYNASMLTGFRSFIARGNVVDLAVAVVIGVAFGALVASLVADVLTPLIGAVIGDTDFGDLHVTINGSDINYGNFLNALIAFLSVAAAIYFFVVVPLEKLDELRHGPKEAGTRECPHCISEIPASATRCAFCTSEVPPVQKSPSTA
jgi:large conductance mechanosensitive channel